MRSITPELTAKTKQSLQTLGNVGDPKLKIAVSRAKTTVTDANYWTVETIRAKEGLGDISVAPRRFNKHYGGPDRLYEIHVDSGQVSTAIREYPELTQITLSGNSDYFPKDSNYVIDFTLTLQFAEGV